MSAATNATTLGELQSLVADLQPVNPVRPPVTRPWQRRGGPAVIAAVVGVLVVVCAAIGWGLLRDTGSPTNSTASSPSAEASKSAVTTTAPPAKAADPVRPPDDVPPIVLTPPRELQSADGMAGVIDEIRKRFGDTNGYELAIMHDEALLARPDPADDRSKLVYSFRGGWGDPSNKPRSDTDDIADLGAFDVQAAAAALQAAPETLRIAPADVSSTYIDVDHIADPAGPGALELLVKVTTTSGADGYIYLDGAGATKRVEYPS